MKLEPQPRPEASLDYRVQGVLVRLTRMGPGERSWPRDDPRPAELAFFAAFAQGKEGFSMKRFAVLRGSLTLKGAPCLPVFSGLRDDKGQVAPMEYDEPPQQCSEKARPLTYRPVLELNFHTGSFLDTLDLEGSNAKIVLPQAEARTDRFCELDTELSVDGAVVAPQGGSGRLYFPLRLSSDFSIPR